MEIQTPRQVIRIIRGTADMKYWKCSECDSLHMTRCDAECCCCNKDVYEVIVKRVAEETEESISKDLNQSITDAFNNLNDAAVEAEQQVDEDDVDVLQRAFPDCNTQRLTANAYAIAAKQLFNEALERSAVMPDTYANDDSVTGSIEVPSDNTISELKLTEEEYWKVCMALNRPKDTATFQVGDIVTLKTGSRDMCVCAVDKCLITIVLPAACLKKMV